MKRALMLGCVVFVLSIFLSAQGNAQSIDEIKAKARAEVRSQMGLDQPQKLEMKGDETTGMPAKTKLRFLQEVALIAIVIALIPATIARLKGRSFIAWWVLGVLCFVVALPVAIYMNKLPKAGAPVGAAGEDDASEEADIYKKIENLSRLKEKGLISDEEFSSKKKELLNRI